MPTEIAVLTPQGLHPVSYTAETLDEAARFEPDGIYDVTRLHRDGKVLLLDVHFDRLEESARLEGFALRLDRPAVRAAIQELAARAGYAEARLRLAIGRETPQEIILTLEPFTRWAETLPKLRQEGVKVATYAIHRHNPYAKTNAWVRRRAQVRLSIPGEFYEVIICNEQGRLLEGFTSNFYAIVEGVLHTAPEGILPGIMRSIVLAVAPPVLPVTLEPIRCDQAAHIQEAFLTSTSRAILPIVQIDDVVVGAGSPGPFTCRLIECFDEWVAAHLEPL